MAKFLDSLEDYLLDMSANNLDGAIPKELRRFAERANLGENEEAGGPLHFW